MHPVPWEDSPESGDADERDLLRRIAGGDRETFWILWARHEPWLFQICYTQMGRRREDAEDALSDVMDRAREFLPREADNVRSLTAWLRRMAVNVCIDTHRRQKRRSCVQMPGDTHPDRLAGFSQPDAGPASHCLAVEVRSLVTRAIESLPLRLRGAAKLFFLEEAPYGAIAVALAISEANSRKRIQEARSILREILNVEFPERREPGIAASSTSRTAPAASLAAEIRGSPKIVAQRKQLGAAFGSAAPPGAPSPSKSACLK